MARFALGKKVFWLKLTSGKGIAKRIYLVYRENGTNKISIGKNRVIIEIVKK